MGIGDRNRDENGGDNGDGDGDDNVDDNCDDNGDDNSDGNGDDNQGALLFSPSTHPKRVAVQPIARAPYLLVANLCQLGSG